MTVRYLSHQHVTTLVLTSPVDFYNLFPRYQEEASYCVSFGKDFQETNIKKIECNMKNIYVDARLQLGPLVEDVV